MAQQNQRVVDVLPAADATPAGDGCADSTGPPDLQRLVIDIGDNKTIEITLRGKLTFQSIGAGEGEGGTGTTSTAPQLGSRREHGPAPSENALEDPQFVEQMRGWLMAVATLFVGISFQAAMQPPSWITPNWYDGFPPIFRLRHSNAAAAQAPSPAGAATATMTRAQGYRASVHVSSNTLTLAISLTVLILLLWLKKSPAPYAMATVRAMISALCFLVGVTFLSGNSYGPHATPYVIALFVIYSLMALIYILRRDEAH